MNDYENLDLNYKELDFIFRGLLLLFAKSSKRLNHYKETNQDKEMLKQLTIDYNDINKIINKIIKLKQNIIERIEDI